MDYSASSLLTLLATTTESLAVMLEQVWRKMLLRWIRCAFARPVKPGGIAKIARLQKTIGKALSWTPMLRMCFFALSVFPSAQWRSGTKIGPANGAEVIVSGYLLPCRFWYWLFPTSRRSSAAAGLSFGAVIGIPSSDVHAGAAIHRITVAGCAVAAAPHDVRRGRKAACTAT